MKNWKTTAAGIAAILMALADVISKVVAGNPIDILTTIAGISGGVGLIFSKDHNVTGGTVQQ